MSILKKTSKKKTRSKKKAEEPAVVEETVVEEAVVEAPVSIEKVEEEVEAVLAQTPEEPEYDEYKGKLFGVKATLIISSSEVKRGRNMLVRLVLGDGTTMILPRQEVEAELR